LRKGHVAAGRRTLLAGEETRSAGVLHLGLEEEDEQRRMKAKKRGPEPAENAHRRPNDWRPRKKSPKRIGARVQKGGNLGRW